MTKQLTYTVNDDGSVNFDLDPKFSIGELGALAAMVGYTIDKMLSAQERAITALAKPAPTILVPRHGALDANGIGTLAREGN